MLSESEKFILVLEHYGLFKPEPIYKVVCPFHGDLNPSMQINVPNSYFYCFGCGVHGTTFDLVKLFNPELTSLQIHELINKITKEKGRGIIGGREEYTNLLKVSSVGTSYKAGLKLAKDYYYNLPETNWYKTSEEEVFQAKRYMINRGYKTSTLIKYEAKATYSNNYPIVFPLLENGIFRGYVMRTTDKNVEENRKYMYNKGFKRKNFLIGTYEAKQPVLVVEGYLDLLAAKQLGIENVVAFLGWKASDKHIAKLKHREINHIICGLDNDKAGRAGYEFIKGKFDNVDRIRFPKGIKDFGDLLKNSAAAEQILQQIKKFENV